MDIEAVTELNVDVTVAALIAAQNSRTRTELAKVLPTGGGGGTVALPAAIVTSSSPPMANAFATKAAPITILCRA